MKTTFSYSDSEAGVQTETFNSLSEIVKHIEDFGYNGDSEGIVYKHENNDEDGEAILTYASKEIGLTWNNAK